MQHKFTHILLLIFCLFNYTHLYAHTSEPVSVDINYDAIGEHIVFLGEDEKTLNIRDAIDALETGYFTKWNKPVLTTGIGSNPQWISFSVINNKADSVSRRIVVETSWLDLVEFYAVKDGTVTNQQISGDLFAFNERAVNNRFFAFDNDYPPGQTQVFIRAATPDPMVLPIFFGDRDAAAARDVSNGYSYGLLYGILLALLLYNLFLYLSLDQSRYLYYVTYLLMFLVMNVSYTGHGFSFFWSDSTWLQKWINPFSIALFSTSGVAFAFSFLNIRNLFPRLYYKTIVFCAFFWSMQIIFMLLDMQTEAVATSIGFVMFFSMFTFYTAIISFHQGHRDAIYYLVATIATLFGTAITALTVWAIIPYSTLTYRAAEISISIDALLLSLALAEQIRRAQKEKSQAQQLARIDLLTNLQNRRAFSETSTSIWQNTIQKEQRLCVILMDIDEFKSINDSYGHAVGDTVLKRTAKVINHAVRNGDAVARWGGEEFTVLLPQTTIEKANAIAERIRKNIAKMKFHADNEEFTITVSLGVAEKDATTSSFEEMFNVADSRLYNAKKSGRNQVCTSPA